VFGREKKRERKKRKKTVKKKVVKKKKVVQKRGRPKKLKVDEEKGQFERPNWMWRSNIYMNQFTINERDCGYQDCTEFIRNVSEF
jgi:hypothetical protein